MLMRIRIIEDTLPQGVCGYWHDASRTIWLHDKLNSRQRLCTLQHELIHAGHHDRDAAADTEPSASAAAAGRPRWR